MHHVSSPGDIMYRRIIHRVSGITCDRQWRSIFDTGRKSNIRVRCRNPLIIVQIHIANLSREMLIIKMICIIAV